MTTGFIQNNYYQNKFYQTESDFKNFLELSEEQLSKISKSVYNMYETTPDIVSPKGKKISKFERYQRTLQYLTNPFFHLDLKSFDERIAYLIMVVDPNLVTFKEFLKANIIAKTEIDKITDESEKIRLKEKRNQTISAYKTIVREKIGFFDVKLLKYEELFFKIFFNEKELITEVGSNNQDSLINKVKSLKDFNSISDKRYEELVKIAQNWLSLVPQKHNSKVATYSVTKQKKLLGLNNSIEQITLFILLIDGNLDMLRIYEEESMMQNIEKRIIEQFGYFNKELLILEKKFHDRFCPDKKLSIWTKTKKR